MDSEHTNVWVSSDDVLSISTDVFDYPVHLLGSPRSATKVPIETLQHIFQFCSLQDLHSVALVCQALVAPARAGIFHEVHLANARYREFCELLERCPAIGGYVRSLIVQYPVAPEHEHSALQLASIQARLVHLTDLSLHRTPRLIIGQVLQQGFEQLQSVTLHNCYLRGGHAPVLSTLATMPALRVLILKGLVLPPEIELDLGHKPILRLTHLDVTLSNSGPLLQWLEHVVCPSSLRHLSCYVSSTVNGRLPLIQSLCGSLQSIVAIIRRPLDIYAVLTAEMCIHLRSIDITLVHDMQGKVMRYLPPASLGARSLVIGLPVSMLELPRFALLYARLCALARAGLGWATVEIYRGGEQAGSLETHYKARRMHDYEITRAMVGMLGGRPCGVQPHLALVLPAGLNGEGVCGVWWALPVQTSEPSYIVLEHDRPHPPTRALRIPMLSPKLRAVHFVFDALEHTNTRDLHVTIE